MNKPLVTVVIPVYRVQPYLDRCVSSVVAQTYDALQIILVDDGSPDGCPAMCDAWAEKDSRIRVVHKENAGLGMARNTGLDHAEGDYIFFFDSDDHVDPATVERCVEKAREHAADVVLFGRFDEYEDGRLEEHPVHAKTLVYDGHAVTQTLLPGLFHYELGLGISACGKMFRTQILQENNLRFRSEREIISEDAYFALEFFSKIHTAVIVPQSFYYYCKRSSSLTHAYLPQRQEKNNDFLKKSLSYIEQAGLPDVVAQTLKVRYHSYSIAAMKQAAAADLSKKERKAVLLKMFRDPVLRGTLSQDVLGKEKPAMRLFFSLIKFRCYSVCLCMLRHKIKG